MKWQSLEHFQENDINSIQEGWSGVWGGGQYQYHIQRRSCYLTAGQSCFHRKAELLKKYRFRGISVLQRPFLPSRLKWSISDINSKIMSNRNEISQDHGGRKNYGFTIMGWGIDPHLHLTSHILCFLLMMTRSPQASTCPLFGRPDWFPRSWSTALSLWRFQMSCRVQNPRMDVTHGNLRINKG